jgi:hypothetical protein
VQFLRIVPPEDSRGTANYYNTIINILEPRFHLSFKTRSNPRCRGNLDISILSILIPGTLGNINESSRVALADRAAKAKMTRIYWGGEIMVCPVRRARDEPMEKEAE